MKKIQGGMCRFHLTNVLIVVLAALLIAPASALCKKSKTLGIPGGKGGVVATSVPDAARVGAEILKQGGNAIDAAAAVQFALNVVEPYFSGIGGGGFMVARMADDTRFALDFREEAPGAASKDMYLDAAGNVTDASWIGHLASGVPGSVAGTSITDSFSMSERRISATRSRIAC